MRLTMFTDYALRTLILSASKGEAYVTIEEAAKVYGISMSHLKKVVRTLTQNGFLEAQRGRSGGFRLAGAPDTINLGQVIRATEPDFALVECFREDNRCLITGPCRLPPIIDKALQAMLDVFDQYNLSDVILNERVFLDRAPALGEADKPLR